MNNYKVYQLMAFFLTKFNYRITNVPNQKPDEVFLVNITHSLYPMLRITTSSIEQVMFDKERLHTNIELVFKGLKIKQGRFLDIHIYKDDILDKEEFDSIALDEDYYAGPDLSETYPGIKKVIHHVSDPNFEIAEIMQELSILNKDMQKQKRALKKSNLPLITIVTMVICIVMFLIEMYLGNKYNDINAMIVLGANYKTFTVGLGQFWRLLTNGFLHSGIAHLLFNMLSLYSLGSVLERELGRLKFGLALYLSIIAASLTSLAFNDNIVSVGISGGLYGLFAIYLVNLLYSRRLNNSNALMIIVLNLLISFSPGVDYMAHIGGLVSGIIFYFFLNNKNSILIYICMIVILSYRVYFTDNKYTIYGKTDIDVIEIYNDLGFEKYANNLAENIIEVWEKN